MGGSEYHSIITKGIKESYIFAIVSILVVGNVEIIILLLLLFLLSLLLLVKNRQGLHKRNSLQYLILTNNSCIIDLVCYF